MTRTQKKIIDGLLAGGFIAKTTTEKWTLYDKKRNPVIRFYMKAIPKLEPVLKNVPGSRTQKVISLKAVISLRKSSYIKQQYKMKLQRIRESRTCKPCTITIIKHNDKNTGDHQPSKRRHNKNQAAGPVE